MREISTEDAKVGEHIIVDGVKYVAEECDKDCKGCDLYHCGRCFMIPCRHGIRFKRVEIQDSLPDSKPGPIMSLYEYPALRDHFTMAALTGMLAHSTRYKPREGEGVNWHWSISKEAYELADAMMEARKK